MRSILIQTLSALHSPIMPNMATSAPIAAYPKRKRAQVSYAEPGEEDELVSEFDMSGDDEYSPNKV